MEGLTRRKSPRVRRANWQCRRRLAGLVDNVSFGGLRSRSGEVRMIRGLAIGLLSLSLFGAEPPRQQAQAITTERVNFAPGGTIRLDASYGCLSVEGWDRPEVEIAVTRWMPGFYGAKDRAPIVKKLQELQIKTERRSDTELAISTPPRKITAGVN